MWLQHQCPRGGIGRRAWFRSMCLWVWGFESLRGHHYRIRKKAANFHEFAAFFIPASDSDGAVAPSLLRPYLANAALTATARVRVGRPISALSCLPLSSRAPLAAPASESDSRSAKPSGTPTLTSAALKSACGKSL